ncbi:hypothetical protein Bca4012_028259 [Brassica carinata]
MAQQKIDINKSGRENRVRERSKQHIEEAIDDIPEPYHCKRSTNQQSQLESYFPPPRTTAFARGLRNPRRNPKSRQNRVEPTPNPRQDSTTHDTTLALELPSTEDRAR